MSMLAVRDGDRGKPGNERRLVTAVQPIAALDTPAVAGMFRLYASYYEATSRDLFEHDLNSKDYVVTLHNEAGELAGFSTLALLDFETAGGPAQAIYSGDTIIDHAYWGTQGLAFTWLRFAGSIKARAPERKLFWFLIVKGHRTYRYLSAFAIDFFPHWSMPTPPSAKQIIDDLAGRRFADSYDARRGVVSFPQSRGHLKPEWAMVETDEALRPDVAFFLRSNPGYARGDELVCLTELSPENLRPLSRRVFTQGLRG